MLKIASSKIKQEGLHLQKVGYFTLVKKITKRRWIALIIVDIHPIKHAADLSEIIFRTGDLVVTAIYLIHTIARWLAIGPGRLPLDCTAIHPKCYLSKWRVHSRKASFPFSLNFHHYEKPIMPRYVFIMVQCTCNLVPTTPDSELEMMRWRFPSQRKHSIVILVKQKHTHLLIM